MKQNSSISLKGDSWVKILLPLVISFLIFGCDNGEDTRSASNDTEPPSYEELKVQTDQGEHEAQYQVGNDKIIGILTSSQAKDITPEEIVGGEKGDPRVVELQQLLKDNAYEPGEVDGNLSFHTIKAIDAFRRSTSLTKHDGYGYSQSEFKEMVNLLKERVVLVGHWRQDTGLVEIKLLLIGARIKRIDDLYWGYRNWKLKPQGILHWFSSGKEKQIWNYSIINQNKIELVINGYNNTWNRIR
ncbi:hypothetical protein N9H39_08550 [Gammaproteobacteria bacterium]|nr:hypothetical protein [Gammaproteobacteria bacterium]